MSQTTLKAAVLGSMLAVASSGFLLAGFAGAACVLALLGAAIPTAVLYVRFTA
jgi:hypothetical protein